MRVPNAIPRSLACLTALLAGGQALSQTKSPCESLPLLSRYVEAGVVSRTSSTNVTLWLDADLHSADCGAPDCYGTRITLALGLREMGGRCMVNRARAVAVDYAGRGCGSYGIPTGSARFKYVADPQESDLADRSLRQLVLRDDDGGGAIVLLSDNFFYFDAVTEDGVLRTELIDDVEDYDDCCWGATSAMLLHFEPRLSEDSADEQD